MKTYSQTGAGGEDVRERRKRLLYRSGHRGMREMDMILGAFAQDCLEKLDTQGLDEYEALLNHSDNDLYSWISGRTSVPEKYRSQLLDQFVAFKPDSLKT